MNQELTVDDVGADFVPRPRPRVASVAVDGHAVLLDADTGGTHQLDSIGAAVWAQFDGTATLGEHSVELAAAFGAPPAVVERDVVALARTLGASGLLGGVQAGHQRGRRPRRRAPEPSPDGVRYLGVPGST